MFDKIPVDSLIKKTHQIEEQTQLLRDIASKLEVCGADHREMVKVIMDAKHVVKKVSINPVVMGNKIVLEKLIIEAVNNAARKVEKCMQDSMISLSASIHNAFSEIRPPF